MTNCTIGARSVALATLVALVAGQAHASDPARALVRTPESAELEWGPCPPIFPSGCAVAVLQGDPARGRSDVFLRVPPGMTLAQHTHTSAEHIVLVAGELEVEYAGQPAARLQIGSYAYGPPSAPHRATCVSADACVLFIAFESPIDALPVAAPPG